MPGISIVVTWFPYTTKNSHNACGNRASDGIVDVIPRVLIVGGHAIARVLFHANWRNKQRARTKVHVTRYAVHKHPHVNQRCVNAAI